MEWNLMRLITFDCTVFRSDVVQMEAATHEGRILLTRVDDVFVHSQHPGGGENWTETIQNT